MNASVVDYKWLVFVRLFHLVFGCDGLSALGKLSINANNFSACNLIYGVCSGHGFHYTALKNFLIKIFFNGYQLNFPVAVAKKSQDRTGMCLILINKSS